MRSLPLPTPTQPREVDVAWLVAIAVGVACLLVFWRIFDVPVADGAKYCGYVALFVALPGTALLSLLRGRERTSGLEMVVVGMPLGFALGVLGAAGSLALGLRWFAPYASLMLGLLCLGAALVTRGLPRFALRTNAETRRDVLVLGALIGLSVLLTGLEVFPLYPLPDKLPNTGAAYVVDMPWHIGNVASLKSFWPPTDLRILDFPLRYYLSYHFHAAMASGVAGIEPAVLVLRLSHPVFVAQIGLGLFFLGREITKRPLGGFLAMGVGLFTSDLSILLGATKSAFYNLFVVDLFFSPTYALGVVTIIAVIFEFGRFFSEQGLVRSRLGVLFVLLLGLSAAKIPALPVVAAACAGVFGLDLLRTRRLPGRPLVAFLLTVVATLLVWPWVTIKASEGYIRFAPLVTIGRIPAYGQVLGGREGGAWTAPFRALFVVFAFAPVVWIGLFAFLKKRRGRLESIDISQQFLGMLALAGGGAVLLLDGAGLGQIWFWLYGYIGVVLLATVGLLDIAAQKNERAFSIKHYAIGFIALLALCSTLMRSVPGLRVALGFKPLPAGPLTPARAEAFRWIRAFTPVTAIMAIDHDTQMYGSALSERRFLFESDEFAPTAYLYRLSGGKVGAPPNEELRVLVRRIFEQRDPAALQEAVERYGVGYLLDDKQQNPKMLPFDPSLAKLVFSNSTLDIYVVTAAKKER